MKTLGEVADIRMGFSFRSRLEGNPEGNWAVLQMKDIDEGCQIRFELLTRIDVVLKAPKQVIRKGDLIFRSRGQSNNAALVDRDFENIVLAAPLLLLRPKQAVLPTFLHWWINHPVTQSAISDMAEGTSVRMISKESLGKIEIPLPSLAVQRSIADLAEMARKEQDLLSEMARLRKRWSDAVLMDLVMRQPGPNEIQEA